MSKSPLNGRYKPQTLYFSQDLFGGWTLESLTEEIKQHAKKWGVPRSSVVIDAEQDFDEAPRIQIRAERPETKAEALARALGERRRLVQFQRTPPDSETDPVGYIQWMHLHFKTLKEQWAEYNRSADEKA
jgi:hypothetical protein